MDVGAAHDGHWLRLQDALCSERYTSGRTHNFYLYPARFSPEIARAVIESFSHRGEWFLDPFMGGGTSIVEAVALGRRACGVDLNSLGHFISTVRTTPLSEADENALRQWVRVVLRHDHQCTTSATVPPNLPASVRNFMLRAACAMNDLAFPRQRAFARCALLRLGQLALDCRDADVATASRLRTRLPDLVGEMLNGLRDFTADCRRAGVLKNQITARRTLLFADSRSIESHEALTPAHGRVRLVFTSPPYPLVHVLYHRWQVEGRRETAAPYWIAQVPDGHYASYYTGGSRSPTGERNYFQMIREVFSSVRSLLARDAVVVQLVGFADMGAQYPQYMQAMEDAGFSAWMPGHMPGRLERRVPNRRWYAKLKASGDASSEVLLFHRARGSGTQ